MIPENILQELIEAKEEGYDFNKWESDFIDSISEQFDEGKKLTDKQIEKLESIHDKMLRG